MALTSAGQAGHPVTRKCVEFLVNSVRSDGSWPIDSNLSCWLTTLAVNALDGDVNDPEQTRDWILRCQFREPHLYTNAAPGGWGWTHLPGSVPDADDTAGALLALARLPVNEASREAARRGARWLLDLQNRDGGWPTFCRGWTNLPFDRSGADLTAHAMRALAAWRDVAGADRAISRGLCYLSRAQRPDGSWLPLWFGNEHVTGDENPVYGTAKVLLACDELGLSNDPAAQRGRAWLSAAQNDDGGWGGARGAPSSVEETALAVAALRPRADQAAPGLRWLADRVDAGAIDEPTPIGFYFAKLWYFEQLYPLIFTVDAFRRARKAAASGGDTPAPRAAFAVPCAG
jgi:squalene-hopene/tetraprenyl-beta-curcumene cyclase